LEKIKNELEEGGDQLIDALHGHGRWVIMYFQFQVDGFVIFAFYLVKVLLI
jgi:hypothetical protein